MAFDSTFEERVAIMIHDGGLTESRALQIARGQVKVKSAQPAEQRAAQPAEQLTLPGISPKAKALLEEYYKTHGGKHG